ncbi:MAG TPA: ATP-binding protein [Chitinophagales bacterium]|nr:ATP-binding protein [Chitinophagales bacterium]
MHLLIVINRKLNEAGKLVFAANHAAGYNRTLNLAVLFALCTALIYLLPAIIYSSITAGLLAICLAGFGVSFFNNHNGKYASAANLFLCSLNLLVLSLSVFLGLKTGVNEFFYIAFASPFLVFNFNQRKQIMFWALVSVTMFVISGSLSVYFPATAIPSFGLQVISLLNTWLMFAFIALGLYTLVARNQALQNKADLISKDAALEKEQLLRARQDLEQLAYVISHDLRSPVRNIASFMKLLNNRLQKSGEKDVLEFVDLSRSGADKLSKQLDDVLVYCRINRNLPAVTEVDIADSVRMVELEMAEKLKQRNACITIERTLPKLTGVHASLMHHFIHNLVANGVKFNDSTRPEVRLNYKLDADGIVFSISDNGIGINPGFEEKLFHLFRRLHTADQYEGSGIGLALCKKIIGHYNGKIWYESAAGEGTTFYFSLGKEYLLSEAPDKNIENKARILRAA